MDPINIGALPLHGSISTQHDSTSCILSIKFYIKSGYRFKSLSDVDS